jgi:hypothetical protein
MAERVEQDQVEPFMKQEYYNRFIRLSSAGDDLYRRQSNEDFDLVTKRMTILEPRVMMIDGRFDLPEETVNAMNDIRVSVERCAHYLYEVVFCDPAVKLDMGRAIAAIDLLQQVKNVACDAVILPHHHK